MRPVIEFPSEAAARAFERVCGKLLGYPKRGVDQRTGIERTDDVGITTAWSGIATRAGGVFAVDVEPTLRAAVADAVMRGRLTGAERTALDAATALEIASSATWADVP